MLLKPSVQNKEDAMMNDLDFKVLPRSDSGNQQYLVFKKDLDIYFFNLMSLRGNKSQSDLKFKKLNKLELDRGQIGQLLAVYKSNTLQFLYTQAAPLQNFVFTWDLDKNMEMQMHTFNASAVLPSVYISKGVTTRENYFIPHFEENFYDLRFSFQVNFFRGDEANKGMKKFTYRE
jgi:hypothetical protein